MAMRKVSRKGAQGSGVGKVRWPFTAERILAKQPDSIFIASIKCAVGLDIAECSTLMSVKHTEKEMNRIVRGPNLLGIAWTLLCVAVGMIGIIVTLNT
jgi:hypothetical protein